MIFSTSYSLSEEVGEGEGEEVTKVGFDEGVVDQEECEGVFLEGEETGRGRSGGGLAEEEDDDEEEEDDEEGSGGVRQPL